MVLGLTFRSTALVTSPPLASHNETALDNTVAKQIERCEMLGAVPLHHTQSRTAHSSALSFTEWCLRSRPDHHAHCIISTVTWTTSGCTAIRSRTRWALSIESWVTTVRAAAKACLPTRQTCR